MDSRGIKLAELSRITHVPYRTLQDIMDEKSTARISTVAAIAAGLGLTPDVLLRDPEKPQKMSKSDYITNQYINMSI